MSNLKHNQHVYDALFHKAVLLLQQVVEKKIPVTVYNIEIDRLQDYWFRESAFVQTYNLTEEDKQILKDGGWVE